jgi:hypothetical protein
MKATIQTGLYAGNCARMARQRHELITHRSDRDERENPGWWPRNDYGYPVRGHQPALVELAPLASHASVHCHDGHRHIEMALETVMEMEIFIVIGVSKLHIEMSWAISAADNLDSHAPSLVSTFHSGTAVQI